MQRTRSQALVQTNQKGAVKLPAHVPAGRAALTCWRARNAAACPPHAASEQRAALGRHPFTLTVAPQVATPARSAQPRRGQPLPSRSRPSWAAPPAELPVCACQQGGH